jgi:GDP-L-fucose synthase
VEKDWLSAPFILQGKRIWVAGHRGMVGSALIRRLQSEKCEILECGADLRVQGDVERWMGENRPQVVVVAAAKVGGILANATQPADFLIDNLQIETNIIHAAHKIKVEKLLFLGSSCIYSKDASQPISEEALLTGPLEPTNEAYALAKIAGVKMCEAYRKQYGGDFISVMPCNLYGPGDKFDAQASHVIPALMVKAHEAKISGEILSAWGSGRPLREFLYVDDLADALVFSLKYYSSERPLNIGSGEEIPVSSLVEMIARTVGFKGRIVFDESKPDGTPRKLLDSTRLLKAGWTPKTGLGEGLRMTYQWFLDHKDLRNAA